MAKVNWLDEQTAAEKLGYKPRTLRKYVKGGKFKIAFSTITGRKFHYSETDIIRLQNQNSNLKAV